MLTAVGTGNQGGNGIAEIQPCGFMVVLDADWRVVHVSANIGEHFADCGPFMAGQPLAEFFGAAAVHALRNQLALMRSRTATARLFSLTFGAVPKPFDVSMHYQDGQIILEALPSARHDAGDPAGTVRQMAGQLDGCDNLSDLLQRGARALRAVTGFDSVTLFRFGPDGKPAKVAEDARGSAATAIRCPQPEMRIIADTRCQPSRLEPEAPSALIARALLRFSDGEPHAASPQDAAGSLSVPLISAGVPWGVAACLSRSPRHPALDRIVAAELFADLLAMRAELCELRARTGA